jgi:hypothetical protein
VFLAACAIAAFIAHEPVLVLLGERGQRAFAQVKDRAVRAGSAWLAIATITGSAGWWQAPPAARKAVLLPLIFTALLVPAILTRREKTAMGELLIALTFASTLVPVAIAGAVAPVVAVIAGSIWAVIYTLQTFAVRSVRGAAKEQLARRRAFAPVVALSGVAVVAAWVLTATEILPLLAGAAILPAALFAAACAWLQIHPRHLRKIGWSFAASNFISLACLLLALR